MNEKTIFVRHGQVLKVECLRDGVTGEGFFIVKNEGGEAVRASEICVDGVVFTANESKRKFALEGLEYQVFETIQDHLKTNKVSFMMLRDLTGIVNKRLDFRIGLTANTISKICRSLGMRVVRKPEGFAVSVEEEDLKQASLKFENHVDEGTRDIFQYTDGVWYEEKDANQMIRDGAEGNFKRKTIAASAPLPN